MIFDIERVVFALKECGFTTEAAVVKNLDIKLKRLESENEVLKKKIEDIRIVDRAKCLLISYMNMSERDAHRHIEKQAMDMRASKRQIAESILRTYEN